MADLTIKSLSRSYLAGLREVVENCDDREIAKPIYRELMRLACILRDRHNFGRRKQEDANKSLVTI